MAAQLEMAENKSEESKGKDKIRFDDHLNRSFSEELVIGLCGPIGTDTNFVAKCLREILTDDFNYQCVDIKLSDFIKKKFNILTKEKENGFDYFKNLIDKGNDLRKDDGNGILAKLAIHKIAQVRFEKSNKDNIVHSKRICFLINSIKHIEEYELFERVYRELFYFIGVLSPHDLRVSNLIDKKVDKYLVERLIDIDSEQKDLPYGQKVTETFVHSDYFLRVDDSHEKKVKDRLRRFLDLIFGTDIVTPTDHESAMYHAFTAANNSACLSRQVGASITDSKGELISVGWNDVPKAGGDLYPVRLNDIIIEDHRCINKDGGKCFNDFEKNIICNEIADILIKEDLIPKMRKNDVVKKIKESKIKDLIEFSRSVHAEMHAIINGSQSAGTLMRGGKLFCTTYPCHNCARHIVAAGIKEVYYIEPYKKSLAIRLHPDSITEIEGDEKKVRLLLYDGVAPDKYNDLFAMKNRNERKVDGYKRTIRRKEAKPRTKFSLDAIPYLEQKVTDELAGEAKFKLLLEQI